MEQKRPATQAAASAAAKRAIRLVTAIILTLLCSCANEAESGQFMNMNPCGWPYTDTLAFHPDSLASTCNIAVAVRHANGYEYSNIWLELTYWPETADSAQLAVVDTLNLQLADNFGRWHGDGLGVGYQFVDTVARNVRLHNGQPVLLRHIMRVDTLPGIEQIGLIVIEQ